MSLKMNKRSISPAHLSKTEFGTDFQIISPKKASIDIKRLDDFKEKPPF